jgi:hypothetical protein
VIFAANKFVHWAFSCPFIDLHYQPTKTALGVWSRWALFRPACLVQYSYRHCLLAQSAKSTIDLLRKVLATVHAARTSELGSSRIELGCSLFAVTFTGLHGRIIEVSLQLPSNTPAVFERRLLAHFNKQVCRVINGVSRHVAVPGNRCLSR